jgi:hypothetical protein
MVQYFVGVIGGGLFELRNGTRIVEEWLRNHEYVIEAGQGKDVDDALIAKVDRMNDLLIDMRAIQERLHQVSNFLYYYFRFVLFAQLDSVQMNDDND